MDHIVNCARAICGPRGHPSGATAGTQRQCASPGDLHGGTKLFGGTRDQELPLDRAFMFCRIGKARHSRRSRKSQRLYLKWMRSTLTHVFLQYLCAFATISTVAPQEVRPRHFPSVVVEIRGFHDKEPRCSGIVVGPGELIAPSHCTEECGFGTVAKIGNKDVYGDCTHTWPASSLSLCMFPEGFGNVRYPIPLAGEKNFNTCATHVIPLEPKATLRFAGETDQSHPPLDYSAGHDASDARVNADDPVALVSPHPSGGEGGDGNFVLCGFQCGNKHIKMSALQPWVDDARASKAANGIPFCANEQQGSPRGCMWISILLGALFLWIVALSIFVLKRLPATPLHGVTALSPRIGKGDRGTGLLKSDVKAAPTSPFGRDAQKAMSVKYQKTQHTFFKYEKGNSGRPTIGVVDVFDNICLGSGGSGTVKPGEFEEQSVAVKFLCREMRQNELDVIIASRENQHPNVARILGFDVGKVIMEKYQSDLESFLNDPTKVMSLTYRNLYKPLFGVASALQHFHQLKISHGDIKPANILVNFMIDQGRVEISHAVITDFGHATLTSDGLVSRDHGGTRIFMAPEKLYACVPGDSGSSGVISGEKADVYSFGKTALMLLVQNVEISHLASAVEFPGKATMLRIVKGCLRKQPSKRWSFSECCRELGEVEQQVPRNDLDKRVRLRMSILRRLSRNGAAALQNRDVLEMFIAIVEEVCRQGVTNPGRLAEHKLTFDGIDIQKNEDGVGYKARLLCQNPEGVWTLIAPEQDSEQALEEIGPVGMNLAPVGQLMKMAFRNISAASQEGEDKCGGLHSLIDIIMDANTRHTSEEFRFEIENILSSRHPWLGERYVS